MLESVSSSSDHSMTAPDTALFSSKQNNAILIHITKTCLFKYIENFASKNWKFQIKNSDIFHISAQNIFLWVLIRTAWGSSNEYPQSMFLNRNKNNNVYPCKPVLLYKNGIFRGHYYIGMFSWWKKYW